MHIWYGPALRREAGAIGGVLRVSAPLRGLDLFHLIIYLTTLDAFSIEKKKEALGCPGRMGRGGERIMRMFAWKGPRFRDIIS